MESNTARALDEILTVSETAKFFKIGNSTLYRLVERGQIPALRLGKSIRFRKSVLLTFLNQQDGGGNNG